MTDERIDEKRKWIFSVEDVTDDEFHLDGKGEEIDYSDAVIFEGSRREAGEEGDRRANLWEQRTGVIVFKITSHSLGKVK